MGETSMTNGDEGLFIDIECENNGIGSKTIYLKGEIVKKCGESIISWKLKDSVMLCV